MSHLQYDLVKFLIALTVYVLFIVPWVLLRSNRRD